MKRLFLLLLIPSLTWAVVHPIPHYDFEPLLPCACRPLLQLRTEGINEDNLAKFAEFAATNLYSYGFGNYQAAFKNTSHFFTPAGWETIQAALEESGNVDEVVENQMIVSSKILEPAFQVRRIDNESWLYQMVLQVTYAKPEQAFQQRMRVRILLKQFKDEPTMDSIGVEQFVADVIQPRNSNKLS